MTIHQNDLIRLIEKCVLFSALPVEKIQHLLMHCSRVELAANDILFYQGDYSDFAYILISGELIATVNKSTGNEIVGSIHPMESVGELGALSGDLRSLTVQAAIKSELLKIPSEVFKSLCSDYPQILSEVSKIIIKRTLKTIKLISHEAFRYNISIIYPAIRKRTRGIVKCELKNYLAKYDIKFLSVTDNTIDEIKQNIIEAEEKDTHLIIFMDTWIDEIFQFCLKKINHLYLLVHDREFYKISPVVQTLLHRIEEHKKIRLELILMHRHNIKKIANTAKWLSLANFQMHHHIRFRNILDYERLARFITGNAIALVLGGGGARGLFHLGVIKALIECGIPIDAIGGTSVGASVAAAFAASLNYEIAEDLIHELKTSSLRSLYKRHLTWPTVSLYSGDPATTKLKQLFGNIRIENLWIPFFTVSSDLLHKKEKIQKTGLVWEALRSSAALPGIFPPFVSDDQILFDGGLLNNLPVDAMRDYIGASHRVIASSISGHKYAGAGYRFPPVLSFKKMFAHKVGFLKSEKYSFPPLFQTFLDALLLGSSAAEERNCRSAEILIRPNLFEYKSLSLSTEAENKLLEIGYRETLIVLEKFLELNPDFKNQHKL